MKEQLKKKIFTLVTQYYEKVLKEQPFLPGESRIDPSGKLFDEKELINGVEAVLDGWWTEGHFAEEFSKKFAQYAGVKHVLLTNSGSSANLLAFHTLTSKALGDRQIKPGDEVITAAVSFPTTVNPIVQYGARPVFLDVVSLESGQYNIDCSQLEHAITPKTKAIFVAHTLGNPFDLARVMEIAQKHNLWVIEDCCDALGSTFDGKKVGSFGDLATCSFYPAHHITMGEGGAVLVNNGKLKKIAVSFRNWGRDCWCDAGKDNTCGKRYEWELGRLPRGYDHKNIYTHLGFNLKLTDMQAAIGLAQLEKLEGFVEARKKHFIQIKEHLSRYSDCLILPSHLDAADPSWFGFLISVREDAGFSREELVNYLTERRIMSRNLFSGNITRQPSFEDVEYRVVGDLTESDRTMKSTFWIGVQPNLTSEKIAYLLGVFDEFFKGKVTTKSK